MFDQLQEMLRARLGMDGAAGNVAQGMVRQIQPYAAREFPQYMKRQRMPMRGEEPEQYSGQQFQLQQNPIDPQYTNVHSPQVQGTTFPSRPSLQLQRTQNPQANNYNPQLRIR